MAFEQGRGTSGGSGGGNASQDVFTSVGSQAAYTRPDLSGKTINRISIGQTIIDPANYNLSGTTLTFTGFTVANAKKVVVDYE